MIIIILLLIMILMVVFVLKTRNMLSLWLLIVYLGCFATVLGYTYYYAKNIGFSRNLQVFLFLNERILRWLTYQPIGLDQINMQIVSGRGIFLFAVLCFSVEIYTGRSVKENLYVYGLISILPVLNIMLYSPDIYRQYFMKDASVLNAFTRLMIVGYTFCGLLLLLIRYYQINIPWIKKQLMYIFLELLSIVMIFYLFGFFGTLQVVDIFSMDYLYSGFGLAMSSDAIGYWYAMSAGAAVATGFGYMSLWHYAKIEKQIGRPDLYLERKIKTAHMGAKVFTHGIKNQLLVSRVMLKRINALLDEEDLDREKLKENLAKANEVNERTLQRMDALYQTFKSNALSLKPVTVKDVVEEAVTRAKTYNHNCDIVIDAMIDQMILADQHYLSEAIYNILINGMDAIAAIQDDREGKVIISCRREGRRLMVVIEDNGIGIHEEQLTRIFDPFVTSKNTNHNWGIGLSQAQQTIDGHFGTIRIDSSLGVGTKFLIDLPFYRMETNA